MTNTAPARRTASEALREAARDPASLEAPHSRAAPHNLEAEQALLGAILVNNEAHDRVSGFLDPHHFFDPLHQQIYETAAKLIAAGKQATPITLKTFFETAEPIGSGLSVPAYLGQLAANATTIINVRDYGRIDLRLTTSGEIYVIEVNANCYLVDDGEFAMAAAADGLEYPELIGRIVELAVERRAQRSGVKKRRSWKKAQVEGLPRSTRTSTGCSANQR